MRSWLVATAVATAIVLSGSPLAAQGSSKSKKKDDGKAPMRFKAMDRNGDGRIARSEWRGSAQSFSVHDWNGDTVLSGEEVREGAQRQRREKDAVDFESADKEYRFDDWTPRGFDALDHNRDSRIAADEWHFDREGFRRVDHNRDGVISRAEFLHEESAEDDDRDDRFQDLDHNGDRRISRSEWHGTAGRFTALDDDRNGFLTPNEMNGNEAAPELFTSVDVNRDGWIGRPEWHWSQPSFDQRDTNNDGRLSREEFAPPAVTSRNTTARAGYERGITDGRQAGLEDRAINRWDLEGQRELEQSDAGYHVGLGPRGEYQAGYRDGFRMAYRQGFGR